ncbi:D-aminoacylase [Mycobacterium sp.]|uniref:N-acyl-D-amino-acid deacylase family protein n=1 Tax=Mycobacterium sp. TaxID=1785 RepID=UPI0031D47A6C
MPYDIAVTGGLVVDGTGSPARRADLALAGDTIVDVGDGTYAARTVLDATGCVVAPGFIDLHTHADFSLLREPAAQTQLFQGVTTIVTGNCGHSPFPIRDDEKARRSMGVIGEGRPGRDASGAAGFGAAVMSANPAVNVALQLGHNALRRAVMGEEDRRPAPAELDEMCSVVADAARQPGVVGFSTGLIYLPGMFADSPELTTLAGAAADAGLLYSTHIRDEASHLVAAVQEAISVAEQAGARLEISHLKAMGPQNWGSVRDALALIDAARDRGLDVTADVYPYTASSTDLATRLPRWALDGGRPALLSRLADPEQRAQIAHELRARFGRDVDPDGIMIADLPPGEFSRYVGWSIAAVGADRDTDPAEAALDLLAAHQGAVPMVNHAMSDDDVCAVLAHPWVSVASDGWVLAATGQGRPHPRSFGTFARVLRRYVTDTGVLTLEEAIRKMTSLPASRIGAGNRGVLRPGAVGDIVVFDPETVTDTATFTDPWQLACGVRAVLVNGVAAIADGRFTDRRAGRLVESSASA